MQQQRKLAAIMFTDIVGYTALMQQDEDKAVKISEKKSDLSKISRKLLGRLILSTLLIIILAIGGFFLYNTLDFGKSGKDFEKPIAVLPFVNMSGEPEQEYFSNGITEEIHI